jgi:hypothetical protein
MVTMLMIYVILLDYNFKNSEYQEYFLEVRAAGA